MDLIENQIHDALRGTLSEDGHSVTTEDVPGSPLQSPASTIRRRRSRARDSTQTTVSIDASIDFTKKPMSVIGALHDGPVRSGLGSIVDGDHVSTADRLTTKTEGIAQRVANIQAKVRV